MKKLMGRGSAEGGLRDEDFSKTSLYDKGFKPVRRLQDPRLGEVNLLSNTSSKESVIAKERKFNDKSEMTKAILGTRAKIANQTPYNLRLLDYSTTKQSELCSTIYILRQFYEYCASDLRRELTTRQSTNTHFSPAELGDILYRTAKADPLGTHGDISPSNIVYDKPTNTTKLVDRSDELPTAMRALNIQKNKMGSNQPLYQSPYMHSNLKRNNLKFNFDSNKEDAFALGLTLLELGNLKPVSNIYDASKKEIDPVMLSRHMDEFRSRYGPASFLSNVVENLTKFDELHRLGMKELDASLPNEAEYRNRIVSGTASFNPAPVITSTGMPIVTTTTNTIGGIEERVTRIDTTITTTPIMGEVAPSIYSGANSNANAFYEKPVLPSLAVHSTDAEYRYTPPAAVNMAPVSHITVSRSDLTAVPKETRNVNTFITENHKTYISPSGPQDYRTNTTNYTSYKNNELGGTFGTLPSGNTQYAAYANYAPATANRIILEPEIRREVITAAPVAHQSYYTSTIVPKQFEPTTTVYTQPASQIVYTTPQVTTTSYAPSYLPPTTLRRSYSTQSVSVAQPARISTYQASPVTYINNAPISYETTTVMASQMPSTMPMVTEYKTIPTTYTTYPAGSRTNITSTYPVGSHTNVISSYPTAYETYVPSTHTTYETYAPNTYTTYEPITQMAPTTYQQTTAENYYHTNNNGNQLSSMPMAPATTYYAAGPSANPHSGNEYITSSTVIPQTTYINEPAYQHTATTVMTNPTAYTTTNYHPSTVAANYQTTSPMMTINGGSSKQIRTPSSTNVTHYTTETISTPYTTEYAMHNHGNPSEVRVNNNYY